MSTLNPPKKISKRHELREDQVITFYARAWEYYDQNRMVVYGAIAAVVVVILGLIGYGVYQSGQADEAQERLAAVLPLYEDGSYREALDGAAGLPGLLEVADKYDGSDAGNLAHFYAADALFQLGEYEQALEHFNDFDGGDDFIGASALAGEASVYEAQERFSRAGNLYRDAANRFESETLSPQYLLDAGRAYEAAGEYDDAVEVYQEIQERYPESTVAAQLDFYIARAQAKKASKQG